MLRSKKYRWNKERKLHASIELVSSSCKLDHSTEPVTFFTELGKLALSIPWNICRIPRFSPTFPSFYRWRSTAAAIVAKTFSALITIVFGVIIRALRGPVV
jgi:hypothetical protein